MNNPDPTIPATDTTANIQHPNQVNDAGIDTRIIVLTRPPFFWSKERFKDIIKKIIYRKRGPSAVIEGLQEGLREIAHFGSIPVLFDPKIKNIKETDIVHVLKGHETLRFCIDLKRAGKIKKLVAGPLIVVAPEEQNSIIADDAIDLILLPSKWPRDYYISRFPKLESRIKIWASGVKDPFAKLGSSSDKESNPDNKAASQTNNKPFVIYDKIPGEAHAVDISNRLQAKNIQTKVFTYGSFDQRDFFSALDNSAGMIYLSLSESQGLALQEAWIRDVPTFVVKNNTWYHKTDTWSDEQINAPYLTSETGLFFKDPDDLEKIINQYRESKISFNPRQYCLTKFTNTESAKTYLQIVSALHNN